MQRGYGALGYEKSSNRKEHEFMARVSKATWALGFAGAVALSSLVGCQNDKGSTASDSNGKVVARTQHQDVTPEGTAIQTRTQIRETPSGQQIRETQKQTRENVTPGQTGTSTTTTK